MDDTLTYEKMVATIKAFPKLPPRPPWMFSPVQSYVGMPIYPQRSWPLEMVGYHIFPAHPWVRRFYGLLRKVGVKASPWVRLPMMRETPPIVFYGSLVLSQRQYHALQMECVA